MKPKIKAKWVAALRSGEYRQWRGDLRGYGGFCCLGVLCDVHAKETGLSWWRQGIDSSAYMGETGILPDRVCVWAGLDSCDPIMGDYKAAAWNDDLGANFDQIADLIEKHL